MTFRYLALTLMTLFASVLGFSNLSKAGNPNFVFLISEDNSHHYLKLFCETGAETPRIAELASHGILFNNAFSNSPVCSVARTTLITSCYGPRIGTQYHRRSKLASMPEGLKMFPAYLRDAGYYTANNQKKDYNAIEGKEVWDESGRSANWRKRADGQPFFYKQSFGTTHESSLHFKAEAMLTPTSTDMESVFVAPYHPNTPTFKYTYARYHDRIQQVDQEIGRVVDKLASDGLLEDTFIFYFGDHGGVLPRGKGYAYESGLHVPLVVRVPENFKHLVPHPPRSKSNGFVSFIDFGPTVLNLAGLDVPSQIDGTAFLGKGISKDDLESRDFAFGYADRFDEKWDLVRTLRKGRFEYVRNYQPFNFDGMQNNYRYRMLAYSEWRDLFKSGSLNELQSEFFLPRPAEALYDIEADPYETNNLANNPEYASTAAELRALMSEHVKSLPDLSLIPENVLYDEAMGNPVAYGQNNKMRINAAVDIADLALLPFAKARAGIEAALASNDPLLRYWGCISCSAHGQDAADFATQLTALANDDSNLLVRVRAAEFLGLVEKGDPVVPIKRALAESSSGVEAGLMLNSVVMLQDGSPGYQFGISRESFSSPEILKNDSVQRRLEYLSPQPQPAKRQKKKKAK